MEKILLAIDATTPNKNALEFACHLAGLTKSKITVDFLENLVADEKPSLKQMQGLRYVDGEAKLPITLTHSKVNNIFIYSYNTKRL